MKDYKNKLPAKHRIHEEEEEENENSFPEFSVIRARIERLLSADHVETSVLNIPVLYNSLRNNNNDTIESNLSKTDKDMVNDDHLPHLYDNKKYNPLIFNHFNNDNVFEEDMGRSFDSDDTEWDEPKNLKPDYLHYDDDLIFDEPNNPPETYQKNNNCSSNELESTKYDIRSNDNVDSKNNKANIFDAESSLSPSKTFVVKNYEEPDANDTQNEQKHVFLGEEHLLVPSSTLLDPPTPPNIQQSLNTLLNSLNSQSNTMSKPRWRYTPTLESINKNVNDSNSTEVSHQECDSLNKSVESESQSTNESLPLKYQYSICDFNVPNERLPAEEKNSNALTKSDSWPTDQIQNFKLVSLIQYNERTQRIQKTNNSFSSFGSDNYSDVVPELIHMEIENISNTNNTDQGISKNIDCMKREIELDDWNHAYLMRCIADTESELNALINKNSITPSDQPLLEFNITRNANSLSNNYSEKVLPFYENVALEPIENKTTIENDGKILRRDLPNYYTFMSQKMTFKTFENFKNLSQKFEELNEKLKQKRKQWREIKIIQGKENQSSMFMLKSQSEYDHRQSPICINQAVSNSPSKPSNELHHSNQIKNLLPFEIKKLNSKKSVTIALPYLPIYFAKPVYCALNNSDSIEKWLNDSKISKTILRFYDKNESLIGQKLIIDEDVKEWRQLIGEQRLPAPGNTASRNRIDADSRFQITHLPMDKNGQMPKPIIKSVKRTSDTENIASLNNNDSKVENDDKKSKYPKEKAQHFEDQTTNKPTPIMTVSGRHRCAHCNMELGRGAAMIVESLCLFYHLSCFRCYVCSIALGNGTRGADVRVRGTKLHCQKCFSTEEQDLKLSQI